jgi:hypothetical protein
MASIWRHPQSKYWTACFRDSSRRQCRISTKETSRGKAYKIAAAFEAAARSQRTKLHTQCVIAQLHEDPNYQVEIPKNPETIKQIFRDVRKNGE